jgi:hypothetical protein
MAMVPHERSLVERMEGKPFVLLGVNDDEARQTLRDTAQGEGMNWRSWFDAGGRIANDWGVPGFPYLVLIDRDGVIREIIPGRPRNSSYIDMQVDKLLQETQ